MKKYALILTCFLFGVVAQVYADQIHINTYTPHYQTYSAIDFDGTNYLVTWHSGGQDSSGNGIYGQRIGADGALVGSEFQINTYFTNEQIYPAMSFGDTNYLVTWTGEGQDDNSGIFGQRVGSDGSLLGSQFRINSFTSYGYSQTNSAVSFDGTNHLVTWHSHFQDGSGWGIYGQRVGTDGSLVGSEFKINTYVANDQYESALAFDGTNYLVTWTSIGQGGIYGQRVGTDGSLVGSELKISSTTGGEYSSLAFDGTNYLVTWSSYGDDGDAYGIFGRFVGSDGNPIGTDFQINTYTAGQQNYSCLTFDGENYLVTWYGVGDVYGQLVGTDGALVGSEFIINAYTTGEQWLPSLVFDGSKYLVVWGGDGPDEDYYGIYGEFVGTDGSLGITVVPEPLSIGLLGLAVIALLRRLRK